MFFLISGLLTGVGEDVSGERKTQLQDVRSPRGGGGGTTVVQGNCKVLLVCDATTGETLFLEYCSLRKPDYDCWMESKWTKYFMDNPPPSFPCRLGKNCGSPGYRVKGIVILDTRFLDDPGRIPTDVQFEMGMGFVPIQGHILAENSARNVARWPVERVFSVLNMRYGLIGASYRSQYQVPKKIYDEGLDIVLKIESRRRDDVLIKNFGSQLLDEAIDEEYVKSSSTVERVEQVEQDHVEEEEAPAIVHGINCFDNSAAIVKAKSACQESRHKADIMVSDVILVNVSNPALKKRLEEQQSVNDLFEIV